MFTRHSVEAVMFCCRQIISSWKFTHRVICTWVTAAKCSQIQVSVFLNATHSAGPTLSGWICLVTFELNISFIQHITHSLKNVDGVWLPLGERVNEEFWGVHPLIQPNWLCNAGPWWLGLHSPIAAVMTSDFKNTIHIVCRVEPIVDGFALLHTAPLVACGHINPSNLNNTHASKFFILVVRHTSPIYYNITSLQGPRIHLPDAYFLFCKTASHSTPHFSCCCAYNMVLFTSSHLSIPNIDVLLRCTTFSQPILPPSSPTMRPDSLSSETLELYGINLLRTHFHWRTARHTTPAALLWTCSLH